MQALMLGDTQTTVLTLHCACTCLQPQKLEPLPQAWPQHRKAQLGASLRNSMASASFAFPGMGDAC